MTAPEEDEERELARVLRGDREEDDTPTDQQLGRTITLSPPTVPNPGYGVTAATGAPADLVWVLWQKPQHATLILQPSAAGVQIALVTSIGGSAKFTRQFSLSPGPATNVRIFGRLIQVSAFLVGAVGTSGVTVSGAITLEEVNPLGDLVPSWVPLTPTGHIGNVGLITPASAAVQQGYFLGCSGFLVPGTGTTGNSYYMMIFDVAPTAVIAANANPLLALGPLVSGQPSAFSFDRSLRPSIRYQSGLQWALSTTPDVYTAVTDGAQARIDADYGA